MINGICFCVNCLQTGRIVYMGNGRNRRTRTLSWSMPNKACSSCVMFRDGVLGHQRPSTCRGWILRIEPVADIFGQNTRCERTEGLRNLTFIFRSRCIVEDRGSAGIDLLPGRVVRIPSVHASSNRTAVSKGPRRDFYHLGSFMR